MEGGADARPLPEVAVEAGEEVRRLVVAQPPEAGHHGVRAGLEEGAGEAYHPFAAEQGAGVAAARGEHHDAPAEVEADDLADLQQAVLGGGAGREQHPRAVGIDLVGDRVGGEVEHAEAAQRGPLQIRFGGRRAQALRTLPPPRARTTAALSSRA